MDSSDTLTKERSDRCTCALDGIEDPETFVTEAMKLYGWAASLSGYGTRNRQEYEDSRELSSEHSLNACIDRIRLAIGRRPRDEGFPRMRARRP